MEQDQDRIRTRVRVRAGVRAGVRTQHHSHRRPLSAVTAVQHPGQEQDRVGISGGHVQSGQRQLRIARLVEAQVRVELAGHLLQSAHVQVLPQPREGSTEGGVSQEVGWQLVRKAQRVSFLLVTKLVWKCLCMAQNTREMRAQHI